MLIASDLDYIGLIAITHNNINSLFIEYRQKGGKNMFYGKCHNGFEYKTNKMKVERGIIEFTIKMK